MIRNFDLYAPTAPKEKRIQFIREVRCVSSLFERFYIPSKETGSAWKIIVDVVPKITKPDCYLTLGAINIQVEGNINDYFKLDDFNKKKIALDYLMSGVADVANQLKYEMNQFIIPQKKVIDSNYLNEWTFNKPTKNKSKTLSAELFIEHGIKEASLSLVFKDKQGNIVRKEHLVSTLPHEFCFYEYLGKLNWINDSLVELKYKKNHHQFTVEVNEVKLR